MNQDQLQRDLKEMLKLMVNSNWSSKDFKQMQKVMQRVLQHQFNNNILSYKQIHVQKIQRRQKQLVQLLLWVYKLNKQTNTQNNRKGDNYSDYKNRSKQNDQWNENSVCISYSLNSKYNHELLIKQRLKVYNYQKELEQYLYLLLKCLKLDRDQLVEVLEINPYDYLNDDGQVGVVGLLLVEHSSGLLLEYLGNHITTHPTAILQTLPCILPYLLHSQPTQAPLIQTLLLKVLNQQQQLPPFYCVLDLVYEYLMFYSQLSKEQQPYLQPLVDHVQMICYRQLQWTQQQAPHLLQQAFHEAQVLQCLNVLDVVLQVSTHHLCLVYDQLFPMWDRVVAKQTGLTQLALLQLLVNHANSLLLKPTLQFQQYFFKEFLVKHFSDPLLGQQVC